MSYFYRKLFIDVEHYATLPFAIRGLGINESMSADEIVRPNGTEDWFILFMQKNKAKIEGATIYQNKIIIWPPGCPHRYGDTDNDWIHSWIHCNGSKLESMVSDLSLPLNKYFFVDDDLMMRSLIELYQEICDVRGADKSILENLFKVFLLRLRKNYKNFQQFPALVYQIRLAIEQTFNKSINVESYAREFNLSTPYLCSLYKQYYGTTIKQTIIRMRMEMALYLLRNINLSISEIANQVGYGDVFQFSKQFKQYFTHSPKQYRKLIL